MKDLETKFGAEHDGKSMHDYFDPIVPVRNEVRVPIKSIYSVTVGIASDKEGECFRRYYVGEKLIDWKTFFVRAIFQYYPSFYPTRLFFFPAYATSNCNE
jgi:hypothetical protein